ncbi:glycosyl transferase group 1 [Chthoniobacter flavus Ellin428]|uniref:Glycosyl transferase group 1 n=1 Tax=Chthoniobacter flavus Ellin428 TaxID=497964 RepID=B4D363_9BACT|nr:glycosyltransferase [Chthoniobacter flavus]EDY19174.1 glycosyl transferase group 1 [Chthoniobacter flavus Ellin428]TCO88020.1 glycosyltransferase involved in cell wall biosynthesis [Chthoniobacter flavus]
MWIERTRRALRHAGIESEAIASREQWIERLRSTREPVLWMASGAWPLQEGALPSIPSSATGRPLIALGAVRDGHEAKRWQTLLTKHGGDFDRRSWPAPRIPTPASALLAPEAAGQLGARLESGDDWTTAWRRLLAMREFRKVHLPILDVRRWRGWRVLMVVTSIQIGGAERVTLDLAHELSRLGVAVAVAVLGRPTRPSFPEPAHFFDLSHVPRDAETRARAIAAAAREFGADLVHGHLLSAAEARAVRAQGVPLVLTLHNMPAGWPAGVGDGGPPLADLILACSVAVAEQAQEANLGAPIRTVWNGIDPAAVALREPRESVRQKWRARLGWSQGDFVIIAIANPRRQKCLARLPAILAAVQPRLAPRSVRLLLAGAPSRGSVDAGQAASELDAAIATYPHPESIHSTGAVQEIGEVLAASDVLASVSAFEGLSLAHLEALAAGLPVVATDAGGTREIAAQTTSLRLLSIEATDDEVAAALAEIASAPRTSPPPLPASFHRPQMAARTFWFYPQILTPRRSAGDGLWLITNNFSIGGAQSSARRLLLGLASRGIKVRAAVMEEHPAKPTPGRAALLADGIPVTAVPPPAALDSPLAVARLLEAITADRPRAILFWNVIPVLKILITDSLLEAPLFDVSPGEMYFHSLARYFANPRPALPCRHPREYGARLAGVVVKYATEAKQAMHTLGTPVHVISNGVPLETQPRPSRTPGLLVLGTAARLSPDKRLGDLLEAVRLAAPRLPGFVLRIAGGVERGAEAHARELRRAARGLPIEWCGELTDTRNFLTGLDLFVMISEPSGCPNASLEALAAGVAVVATDVGGAGEQILDGVCGRLVPRRNAAALAEAIVTLAHDPVLRAAFATAGRAHIRERFSMERMLDNYTALCGL